MKKRIILISLSLILALSLSTASSLLVLAEDAPPLEWVSQFGTSDFDFANAVAFDSTGAYVAGFTAGDAFVRKYDINGNEVWTRQFGTSSTEYAQGISVNSMGVYVAGHTYGAFPGQTSAGGYDAFVTKLNYSVETAIENLTIAVQELNLKQGIASSLDAKLQNVRDSLTAANAGQREDAVNKLQAFINACEAQRGKELIIGQADMLIAAANNIITMLQ